MYQTTINHKLNVGDEAYVMFRNKPCSVRVERIHITITDDKTNVCYAGYKGEPECTIYGEGEIFPTKDELLDSLR